MKVSNINPILFKSSSVIPKSAEKKNEYPQVKELGVTTPDFGVRVPQKYANLGVTTLDNGLQLHSYKLANGYRVSIIPMEGSPAMVKNYVNVGSMNETDDIKGISHFLEHMAFNGSTGENGYIKLNQGDSFNKIDELGGWTNASTNYALTDYVNSTPMLEEKDLEKQIEVIAAMTEDLALASQMIEKEKGPVCSEINMILDNPQTIVMDQTVRSLFGVKSSADELVGGSTDHITNLTKEKVEAYYKKYYTPSNMNLVITGDVNPEEVITLVAKNFVLPSQANGERYEEKLEPIQKSIRKDFISEKANSTEVMLGFAGPSFSDTKSLVLYEVLEEYLASTKVGIDKELKDLNTYAGMGIEKISTNPKDASLIFYAANCADENSEKVLKILFDKISTLRTPDNNHLEQIKNRLIQNHKNSMEYSSYVNQVVGESVFENNIDYLTNYSSIVKSITPLELHEFANKYLDLNKVAITLVHPPVTEKVLKSNHLEASQLSFKGKQPINGDKVYSKELNNNYQANFIATKNDNMYFDLNLRFPINKNINPAVREVLNEIYSQGTLRLPYPKYLEFQEENNINIAARLTPSQLVIKGYSGYDKFGLTVDKTKELLLEPRITEEEVNKAINRLKDILSRTQNSAIGIYINHESENNPLYTSKEKLLNSLDMVTMEDVKALHQYILENSSATVTANYPENNAKVIDSAIEKFELLPNAKPYFLNEIKTYIPNSSTSVLVKEKNASQADILQVFKFPLESSSKEIAMCEILNTILSSSSSIGLFNTLREKEQLAYSVYSQIDRMGDCGEISCHILTTTDNKNTGETSFDNVQKSINGFNNQIEALLNSEYTDKDLESAKRILKAKLLQKEGVPAKINSINYGFDSNLGIDAENQVFNAIDNITREDIDLFAKKVFKNPPTYALVASVDTLEYNKDFLNSLSD